MRPSLQTTGARSLGKRSSPRDVLCKDKTIQKEYTNVYRALLRYQIHETKLIEQTLDFSVQKFVDMSPKAQQSPFAVTLIAESVQDELFKKLGGEYMYCADLDQVSLGIAERLCAALKIGNNTTCDKAIQRKVEIDQQTAMTESDALIIVKAAGEVTISMAERNHALGHGLKLDLAFRVFFLDRQKLQQYNNSTNLQLAIKQDPMPAYMPMMYSPNSIVNGLRSHAPGKKSES